MSKNRHYGNWERVAGLFLAFGVVISFVIFVFYPPPLNSLTPQIIRFLAALTAGFSAYLFTGDLDLKGSLSRKIRIRTGGAFAAFISVFLLFSYGDVINSDLQDLPPETLIELKSQEGVDYKYLSDLLQQGDWKNADRETTRILMSLMRQNEEGWVPVEAIQELPCSELRIINQLWSDNSNGRFGFSIQKRIYLSVGGRNPSAEDRQRFNQSVGWSEDFWDIGEVPKSYESMSFSLSAPEGHLPYFAGGVPIQVTSTRCIEGDSNNCRKEETVELRIRGGVFSDIFARINSCGL